MTEQTINRARKAKKLALVGMALGFIGTATGMGVLFVRSCVPEVREFRKMYEGKEAVIRTIGRQTQVNCGYYVGIDYWDTNGKGTYEEIAELKDGHYEIIKSPWLREKRDCKELTDKFNDIVNHLDEFKKE